MKTKSKNQGQAIVALVVFIAIASLIIFSTITISSTNSTGATIFQQGLVTEGIANSGIENALLRLLRDPNYTGETMTFPEGSTVVTITGDTNNKSIQSIATIGNFQRKIITKIAYNNGVMTIITWQDSL